MIYFVVRITSAATPPKDSLDAIDASPAGSPPPPGLSTADRALPAGVWAAPVIDSAGRYVGLLDVEAILAARPRHSVAESEATRILGGRRRA